jgi:hypothetical protein
MVEWREPCQAQQSPWQQNEQRDRFAIAETGKNQLLVKFYNRYGWQLEYGINKDINQVLYRQKLTPRDFSGLNSCELKLSHPKSVHQPIRMNNVRIELISGSLHP